MTRRVTRTATVPLEGNNYGVDPALVGRRVELRYDPEDLTRIDVYVDGTAAGVAPRSCSAATPTGQVPQAARPTPEPTGVDYLGLVAAAHDTPPAPGRRSTTPSWPSARLKRPRGRRRLAQRRGPRTSG